MKHTYLAPADKRLIFAALNALESPHTVKIAPYVPNRSLSQNALSHKWYSEVADTEGEYTSDQVKSFCKLRYGVPILREDADFNEFCVLTLDNLTYEQRVKAMRYTPVTSLMKTKQMSTYLEAVQRHYAGRVDLRFPVESY